LEACETGAAVGGEPERDAAKRETPREWATREGKLQNADATSVEPTTVPSFCLILMMQDATRDGLRDASVSMAF
jgi:hydrogenase maturation factor